MRSQELKLYLFIRMASLVKAENYFVIFPNKEHLTYDLFSCRKSLGVFIKFSSVDSQAYITLAIGARSSMVKLCILVAVFTG